MGFASATAGRLWIVAFNDGSTFRLGAVNARSGTAIMALADNVLSSSTAEGGAGAADSAQTIYTGTAVTSKGMRILCYMDWGSGLTTAGTWASGPTLIQMYGPGVARPGMAVQTNQVPKTNTFTSSTATTWTDITGVSASITPTSAANLVEVDATLNYFASAGNAVFTRLVRGSTAIGVGDAASSRTQASVANIRISETDSVQAVPFHWYDFPGSSSSQTYKFQFFLQAGTFYFNQTSSDTDVNVVPRTASQGTVTEIMG